MENIDAKIDIPGEGEFGLRPLYIGMTGQMQYLPGIGAKFLGYILVPLQIPKLNQGVDHHE